MKTKIPELFLRYPGSKAKIYQHIRRALPECVDSPLWAMLLPVYCEPFFGSGAIGWRLMHNFRRKQTRVVINDRDVGVAALWKAIRDVPNDLIRMVEDFEPSARSFYEFKTRDGEPGMDTVKRGFEKLALHQTSFSGLGFMAGGPLGGRDGGSEYNVDCRWSKGRIIKGIGTCHRRMHAMKAFDVRSEDFEPVLRSLPADSFAYLDPPYFVQGEVLYKHAMSLADHERLARLLCSAPFSWVLSYDDCEAVRDLYSWAKITSFDMTPTVRTSNAPRRKNKELLISAQSE